MATLYDLENKCIVKSNTLNQVLKVHREELEMNNSITCIRRLKIPLGSVMQYMHNNPLIHTTPSVLALHKHCTTVQPSRGYAFKSDLKIKWVRPTKIPCYMPEKSGDTEVFPKLDLTRLPVALQDSKELQTANEDVRRLFTLKFLPKKWVRKEYEHMLVERVKSHAYDSNSIEVRISKWTARIRFLQNHIGDARKDVRSRVICKELIDKRKKYLKYLRRWDYKKFEWLLERLNIIYKPPPKRFHWITRKESLRKLTKRHCLGIRQERIQAYKKHLESEQERFLEEKIKALDWMHKEELLCGVETTVKDEDINEVRKKLEQLRLKKQKPEAPPVKIPYNPEALGL